MTRFATHATGTVLDRIAVKRAERIEAEAGALPLAELKAIGASRPAALDVLVRLATWPSDKRAVIAEVKRRSPSKGELAPDLDAGALAAAYERAGAFAVSCLVEPDFFGGGLEDLDAARAAISIPLLYKDFVVDPYQLYQARAHGADMALLIVSLLREGLGAYMEEAEAAGVTPLVEVHDEEEAAIAVSAGAKLIGVNNRNLKTFHTDIAVGERVIPTFPAGVLAVAESGLYDTAQMDRLAGVGARAFLIGESLVVSADPGAALAGFVAKEG